MHAMMMDVPLSTTAILKHAAEYHGSTEIVSRMADGQFERTTYAGTWTRCQKLANALVHIGLQVGDRVGTLAWNSYRHLIETPELPARSEPP